MQEKSDTGTPSLLADHQSKKVIEGLTNLDNLLELHIENQKLFPGEKMHLEPESLSTLKNLEGRR